MFSIKFVKWGFVKRNTAYGITQCLFLTSYYIVIISLLFVYIFCAVFPTGLIKNTTR